MIKFFVEPAAIGGSHIYIEDKNDLHHLIKVLRAKKGMKVSISDGEAWEYETEIEEVDTNCATLKILDKQKFASEPETRVTLYQGVPKGTKMETVIQKNVEMGIDTIVPVFMERTVVVEKGNFAKKLARWQKIADEAVKQCKRGMIPKVRESCSFSDMVAELEDYDLVLCPYENEEGYTIKDCLRGLTDSERSARPENPEMLARPENPEKPARPACSERSACPESSEAPVQQACPMRPARSDRSARPESSEAPAQQACPMRPARKVAIIIGPEGGFADEEIETLSGKGTAIVTLGKTILRTETAGLAALAMVMYELEL